MPERVKISQPESSIDISPISAIFRIEQLPESRWLEVTRTNTNSLINQTSDIESLTQLISVGYQHLRRGHESHNKMLRKAGQEILDRVEGYLDNNLVARYMFPQGSFPDKGTKDFLSHQFETAVDRDKIAKTGSHNDKKIGKFLEQVASITHQIQPDQSGNMIVIDLQSEHAKRKNQAVNEWLLAYFDLSPSVEEDQTGHNPHYGVDLLAKSYAPVFSSIDPLKPELAPFVEKKQFTGGTFGHAATEFMELGTINNNLTSHEHETLLDRLTPRMDAKALEIMRFMASVPKNNLLWSKLINNIFLNDALHVFRRDSWDYLRASSARDQLHYPNMMTSLFVFHAWLSKQIYLPAMDPEFNPHPEFKQLLAQLPVDSIAHISHITVDHVIDQPHILAQLANNPQDEQYVFNSPFVAALGLKNERAKTFSLSFPEFMRKVLRSRSSALTQYWASEYGNFGKELVVGFETSILWVDEVKDRTESFISMMKNNLGEVFFERLNQKGQNLEKVNLNILEKIPASKTFLDQHILFPGGTLPSVIGFSHILFREKGENALNFQLYADTEFPLLEGLIDIENKTINLSVELNQANPGLENIIKNIVISYLADPHPPTKSPEISVVKNENKAGLQTQPYLVPASDEFQSKYQIPHSETDAEDAEIPSEKVENLEQKMQFAKGEVFEQLVGTVLSYTHPDELVLPQYCLDVHQDGSKVIYGDRIDFRVGIELFEVKWGYHTENINKTTEKQISLLSKQPQNNKFLYHLVRMEETGEPNKPLQLMNQMFRENMLTHSVQDYETQDLFETITLAVMELASSQNSTQSIENIQLLRNYLYNEISEANLLTGEERQTKIKKDLTKLASIITQPDATKAFDDLNTYLLAGNNHSYSPNEATFEWQGVLYTKKIGGNGGHTTHEQAIDHEPSARPMRARGYRGMYSPRLRGVETYMPIYVQKITEYKQATDPAQKANLFQQLVQLKTHFHQPEEAKILSNEKLPESVKLQPVLGSDGQPVIDPRTGRFLYTKTWVEPHFIPGLTQEEKDDIQVIYANRFADSSPLVLQDYLKSWIFPDAA